jgi:amino acid adenylation domain-containing protein
MSTLPLNRWIPELASQGITLTVSGDNLELAYGAQEPDESLLREIRRRKTDLLEFLAARQSPIPPVTGKTAYRASDEQYRMWLQLRSGKASQAYLVRSLTRIRGGVREALLRAAIGAVTARHETLRTFFVFEEGQCRQRILGSLETPLIVLAASDKEEAAWLGGDLPTVSFDTGEAPLFRVMLLPTAGGDHLLYFVIHHIICDAWSLQILLEELLAAYVALAESRQPEWTPLPIQYKDYAEWQGGRHGGFAYEEDKAFWLKVFETAPEPLALPIKGPRPLERSYKGGYLSLVLPRTLSDSARQWARRNGCSVFTVWYATYWAWLSRITGQQDIVVGTSVMGRDHPSLSRQVGYYAKTMALRMEAPDGASFDTLTQVAKTRVGDSLSHLDYPLDHLVTDMQARNPQGRASLFEVMIDYFPQERPRQSGPLSLEHLQGAGGSSKFDLTFTYLDPGDDVVLKVEFDTDLFDPSDIRSLLDRYVHLSANLLLRPAAPIRQALLWDAAEARSWFARFGCGSALPQTEQTLRKIGMAGADDTLAITDEQHALTYAALREKAGKMAGMLRDRYGLGPGKSAAVRMDRSVDLVVTLVAVIWTGAAFVPIDPGTPSSFQAFLLRDSGASLLLTDEYGFMDVPHGYEGAVCLGGMGWLEDASSTAPPFTADPDDIAYVLYTSGSTGHPKGVEIRQRNIAHYLQWAGDYYLPGVTRGTVGWFTNPAFDLSLTSWLLPLQRGLTLRCWANNDAGAAWREVSCAAEPFCLLKVTPSHVELLAALQLDGLPVERMILGGEEMTLQQTAVLRKLQPSIRLFNEYGPTETTVGCSVEEVAVDPERITIGFPADRTRLYVLDSAGASLPPLLWGELSIGGAGVGKGYRGNADMTAARFVPDPAGGWMYRSGDVCRWLPDGRLEYRGRADGQVKINGYRVELPEVESALRSLPYVDGAAVLVKKNGAFATLLAWVAMAADTSPERVREDLRARLPGYMIPSQVERIDRLPLTANGKVDKKALLAMSGAQRRETTLPPGGDVEQTLLEYFRGLLSSPGIGLEDNLFHAGMDSLRAVSAHGGLDRLFPGRIDINDLFSNPTVSRLAAFLRGGDQAPEQTLDLVEL